MYLFPIKAPQGGPSEPLFCVMKRNPSTWCRMIQLGCGKSMNIPVLVHSSPTLGLCPGCFFLAGWNIFILLSPTNLRTSLQTALFPRIFCISQVLGHCASLLSFPDTLDSSLFQPSHFLLSLLAAHRQAPAKLPHITLLLGSELGLINVNRILKEETLHHF